MAKDDKPTTEAAAPAVKAPPLFKVLKPITYRGEVNAQTVDALILGARFSPAQIAAASAITDKAALVAWYKTNSNGLTHPNLPPVLLPFDHLAESARMLLIKRGVIAAA